MSVCKTAAVAPLHRWSGALADKIVGERARAGRETLCLDVADVADRVGVEPARLAAIEAGAIRPTAHELYALAVALDRTISYFFAVLRT